MRFPVIQVTPEDIAAGVRLSGGSCPVALAIKRTFPEATSVLVLPRRKELSFQFNEKEYVASFGSNVSEAILRFDEVGLMSPFSFKLRKRSSRRIADMGFMGPFNPCSPSESKKENPIRWLIKRFFKRKNNDN